MREGSASCSPHHHVLLLCTLAGSAGFCVLMTCYCSADLQGCAGFCALNILYCSADHEALQVFVCVAHIIAQQTRRLVFVCSVHIIAQQAGLLCWVFVCSWHVIAPHTCRLCRRASETCLHFWLNIQSNYIELQNQLTSAGILKLELQCYCFIVCR